ncbi:MAG: FHA domain-containing protein [Tannerella sp.]|jgi:hypothetical protein|nr:FHA domain-containing protein [Tannerella sp.]
MRCKNCGWDNPDGKIRCEKCSTLLADSVDDYPTTAFDGHTTENFNPGKTTKACVKCGYPLMPGVSECPNCGNTSADGRGSRKNDANGINTKGKRQSAPVQTGTVIDRAIKETGSDETQQRKIIGFLVTYSHSEYGSYYPLYEGKNLVGRNSAMDICIIEDTKISDKHFSILYRVNERKFRFKDEQSTNGTFINGVMKDEGELLNHDEIVAGKTHLTFVAIPQSFK